MKGDFTRNTFRPEKHYSGVRMQQGRVQMDADWNEESEIGTYLDEITRIDTIGHCGGPKDNAGFEVTPSADGKDLLIGAGRYYVDGILCENEQERSYDEQPHPTAQKLIEIGDVGVYVAYLDVWKRHVTALDDAEIKEVALGEPDTATRVQTIWQVRLELLEGLSASEASCDDFGPDWTPAARPATTLRLAARAEPDPNASGPCVVPAEAGYRRLENQLYRVEIHDGGPPGTATFKWSRDNGTVVTRWLAESGNELTVESAGRDAVLGFAAGQWIELTDTTRALNGLPGTLVQLADVQGEVLIINPATATGPTSLASFEGIAKVRRWEGHGDVVLGPGVNWIPLEDGVEVAFSENGAPPHLNTGDYWTIPARTELADVLWPKTSSGDPSAEPPEGIEHHYCPLALLQQLDGFIWQLIHDCRDLFPPLTDVETCCVRVEQDDNLQAVVDELIEAGGGCICLARGIHQITGALTLDHARNLTIHGETRDTVLRIDGKGVGGVLLASCDGVHLSNFTIVANEVRASLDLIGQGGTKQSNRRIRFNDLDIVNLTGANKVAAAMVMPRYAAVRMALAQDIELTGCRLFGEIGIMTLYGESLPQPTAVGAGKKANYGFGVRNLTLRDCRIRYRSWGIWALRGEGWRIEGCDIRCYGTKAPGVLDALAGSTVDLEERRRALIAELNEAMGLAVLKGRAAIQAFTLVDSRVVDCRLGGRRCLDVWWWVRGDVTGSDCSAAEVALATLWGHHLRIESNRLESKALGVGLGGGLDIQLRGNRVRAKHGIHTREQDAIGEDFAELLKQAVIAFPVSKAPSGVGVSPDRDPQEAWVHWILLEEVFQLLELEGVVDALAELAAPVEDLPDLPVLWMAAAGEPPGLSSPIAIITLALQRLFLNTTLSANDVRTSGFAVLFEDAALLGGLQLDDNRLISTDSGAVRLEVKSELASPAVVAALLSSALDSIPSDGATTPTNGSNVDSLFPGGVEVVAAFPKALQAALPGYLNADLRVQGNRITASGTGFWSNLYDIVLRQNQVHIEPYEVNPEGDLGRGIEILSDGARLVDNQVEVGASRDDASWAAGGIRIGAPSQLAQFIAMLPEVGLATAPTGAATGAGVVFSHHRSGAQLTRNTVRRGAAHGIEVDLTTTSLGIDDIAIAANHVEQMQGCGIIVEGAGVGLGLRVHDNVVARCSLKGRQSTLTDSKGGIVVRNVVVCHLNDNDVRGCGVNQEQFDVLGIDLDLVFGLELSRNHVIDNGTLNPSLGTGGCGLTGVHGAVDIRDNIIEHNRGTGLFWRNLVGGQDSDLSLVSWFLSVHTGGQAAAELPIGAARALVVGNRFEQRSGVDLPVFRVDGVREVTFGSNQLRGSSANVQLAHFNAVRPLLVTANQLHGAYQPVLWANLVFQPSLATGNLSSHQMWFTSASGVEASANVPDAIVF